MPEHLGKQSRFLLNPGTGYLTGDGTWSIFEIHGFLNGLTHEYPLTLCTENQRIKIFLNINI